MNRLNEIEARTNAATEGPWVCVLNGDESEVTYANAPITWDDHGGEVFTEGDAEFIAAARTTVPALVDALEKVLELHQPVTDGMGFTEDGYGGISPACSSCGTSDEYAVPYPCPTVTAITTALEATK